MDMESLLSFENTYSTTNLQMFNNCGAIVDILLTSKVQCAACTVRRLWCLATHFRWRTFQWNGIEKEACSTGVGARACTCVYGSCYCLSIHLVCGRLKNSSCSTRVQLLMEARAVPFDHPVCICAHLAWLMPSLFCGDGFVEVHVSCTHLSVCLSVYFTPGACNLSLSTHHTTGTIAGPPWAPGEHSSQDVCAPGGVAVGLSATTGLPQVCVWPPAPPWRQWGQASEGIGNNSSRRDYWHYGRWDLYSSSSFL